MKERTEFHGDVLTVTVESEKFLKKLGKIIELRINDVEGNCVLTFWKGEKQEG